MIRRIAGKLEDDLKVLKGNLKKQGYISEVKSVISEFVQYGVDFDKLDDLWRDSVRKVIFIINCRISVSI